MCPLIFHSSAEDFISETAFLSFVFETPECNACEPVNLFSAKAPRREVAKEAEKFVFLASLRLCVEESLLTCPAHPAESENRSLPYLEEFRHPSDPRRVR